MADYIKIILSKSKDSFPSEAEAAEILEMSPANFSSHFKRSTGITYQEYMQALKLKCAFAYLSMEDMPLKAISSKLNFTTPSHFTYWFRQKTGLTPSEYRNLSPSFHPNPEQQ